MPGLGFAEVLFIFVAALLLFGPRRLPEIGRTLGKGLAEFRKASNELKRSLDAEGIEQDLRETRETIASVDPRRYLREAMAADAESGRVARRKRTESATEGLDSSPAESSDVAALPEEAPANEEAPASEEAPVDATAGDEKVAGEKAAEPAAADS